MKLVTKEIERKFNSNPIYSKDGQGENAEIIVKFFNPCGAATWLITEAEKQDDGDYLLYGYITLGYEYEWGYVLLSQLASIRNGYGLGIERDLYAHGTVKANM
jgi:hypothetical protein